MESYALLQNATQLLAIMLERLTMEEFLNDQKIHLQHFADEKNTENAALNEEYQAMNEELMEGNRNLIQINDQLAGEIAHRKLAEEALKKNRILLCETEKMAKIGGWEFDVKTLKQTWTDETFRILEIESGKGEPIVPEGLDFFAPTSKHKAEQAIQRAIESGEPYDEEWEIITTKGNHRWVRAMAKVNLEQGATRSISGTFQDITELKTAVDDLKTTVQRLESHISNFFAGIIAVSSDDLVENVNQAFCDLFNLSEPPASLIGLSSSEMVKKVIGAYADPEATLVRMREILTRNQPVRGEELAMRNGGYCLVDFIPIMVDGEKRGHIWHHNDISVRRRAEEAVQLAKQSYLDIFNSVSEAIYLLDETGTFIDVNTGAEKMYLYSKEELIGQSPETVAAPGRNNSEEIQKLLHKVNETGMPVRFEFWALRKNGEVFPKEVIVNKGKYFGKDILIAAARDITEQKMAEAETNLKNTELRKLNAEKDKFFSILAHDLRSPFNAFLGFTQIMAEELPSMTLDQIQKIAVRMRKSATNLYGLLENLLEWSRVQRGVISFNPEPIALKNTTETSLESVMESAVSKGIGVNINIPGDIVVAADSHMLETVMRNLVSNAVKYTHKGGEITISTRLNDDNQYETSIKDTGIGLTSEMMSRIFELDSSTNRPGTEGEPSTGLGLIICREFIEKHSGKLWVDSEVSGPSEGMMGGSTFYFTLPGGIYEGRRTNDQ